MLLAKHPEICADPERLAWLVIWWLDLRQGRTAACTPDQAVVLQVAAVLEADAVLVHPGDGGVEVQAHLTSLQGRRGALPIEGGGSGQDARPHLNQMDPG